VTIFWNLIDRAFLSLASVRLTIVVFVLLLFLAIPGSIILQWNISNVDPGIQYDYNFWKFGEAFQLFSAYHSFWYVGLMMILAMNLIACSTERWPSMWKLATTHPVRWSDETLARQPEEFRREGRTGLSKDEFLAFVSKAVESKWSTPVVLEDAPGRFQLFWQTGRWSRISNYLVHTSLLFVFAGGIIGAFYGFEGAANIPSGSAVDTFLIFKEGRGAGLVRAPGGLSNERLLGFRVETESFRVKFYEDFPGRPQEFVSKLNVLENGKVMASKEIRVNDPLTYKNYVFYQASYGKVGDFDLRYRLVSKSHPTEGQVPLRSKLGEIQDAPSLGRRIVPLMALDNLQNLGPAVRFQELDAKSNPAGEPFWVLRDYPQFDRDRRPQSPYVLFLDSADEIYFTGLQIGYDPGAPIYWLGCFGMLLGTFYALFVTHKKYRVLFENGKWVLVGSVHRLPTGFDKKLDRWAETFGGTS